MNRGRTEPPSRGSWTPLLLAAIALTGGCMSPLRRAAVPPIPSSDNAVMHVARMGTHRGSDGHSFNLGLGRAALDELPVISAADPQVQAASSSYDPELYAWFTVSAWVRCDAVPDDYAAIAGCFDPDDASKSHWLVGIDSSGRPFMATTDNGSPARVTASSAVTTGKWTLICAEWTLGTNAALYVDDASSPSEGGLAACGETLLPMRIGYLGDASPSHIFNGIIDEVGIWSRAASSDFRTALYTNAPDTDGDGIWDGDDTDANGDGILDAWAYAYFGSASGGDADGDTDGDGLTDGEEYIVGSNPTSSADNGLIAFVANADEPGTIDIEFEAVAGRTYQIWSRVALMDTNGWAALGDPIVCNTSGPVTLAVDAVSGDAAFYRISVSLTGGL